MLHRKPFHAMGCRMLALLEVESESAPDITSTSLSASLDQVPIWFEQWEGALSRFRYDSELSRLNRSPDRFMPVSQALWEVFQAALAAERATQGLVTPTVLDALVTAGYDRPFDELQPGASSIGVWTDIQPLSLVLHDADSRSICLPPGVHLDFGGIAKGWATAQTVARLGKYGPALMNAGGDIAISAPRPGGHPWRIGITSPFQPDTHLTMLHLHGGGVATSGKDRRRWQQGEVLNHHIIDPRTGGPALTDVLTATVVAPTALEAEAAAKSVFLLGSRAGLEWLEADSALAGLLVLDNGEIVVSSRMYEYL
jgi:thiamine biosynthesis lipoprotein